MSWASVVRNLSNKKLIKLEVKYTIQSPKEEKLEKDAIPRNKEVTPHPADDFVMTNGHLTQIQPSEHQYVHLRLSDAQLILLISGYIRNMQRIPYDIIHCISSYHWFKLYDDFNSFRFKYNLKTNKINENLCFLKYYVMPLNELKSKYLLPFDEIYHDNDNNKTFAKYSSFKSNYCPEFIKEKDCMIHQIELDKNNENIYHLMDSFVVNKFIELFPDHEAGTHWSTGEALPAGKGAYRAGFRCVGNIKNNEKEKEKEREEDDPYNGRWKSWTEIEVNNNNMDNIMKCLMGEIVWSSWSGYNSLSGSGMNVGDWELQRPIFCNKFRELFNRNDINNKIRAFWCRHVGWDVFDEDDLSCDDMLCCIDNEKVVCVWSLTFRAYG